MRCWFAPEDMKIGAKIRDTIDEAICRRDRVLRVLSEASIASDPVKDEVDKAFEEERRRGGVVLFPVRLDDTVMATKEAWAAKLRRNGNIGDFRAWKDHDVSPGGNARCHGGDAANIITDAGHRSIADRSASLRGSAGNLGLGRSLHRTPELARLT